MRLCLPLSLRRTPTAVSGEGVLPLPHPSPKYDGSLSKPAALASETKRGRMNTAWWSFYFRVSWSVNKIQAMGHVYWGHIRGKWLRGWVGAGYVTLSPCLLPSQACRCNSYRDARPWGGQGQLENKALPKQQPKYILINNVCFKNGCWKRWTVFMCTCFLHLRTCLCLSFSISGVLLFA